jgi:hypothetical protein
LGLINRDVDEMAQLSFYGSAYVKANGKANAKASVKVSVLAN